MLLHLRELDTRIERLEGLVDHCIDDMAECRIRIMELQVRRDAILGTLLPRIGMIVESPIAETSNQAPPVSMRETIRRSACAKAAPSMIIARRLGISRQHAAGELSQLRRQGKVSYRAGIYGPPEEVGAQEE